MDGKMYTCYAKLYPEKVQADGAITASKKEVLAWMEAKFGALSDDENCGKMKDVAPFFYEGDCAEFRLADGRSVFLAELLGDDDGPEEEGPEGEDLDDPEEEGPEEEDDDGPEEEGPEGEDLDDPEEEGPEEEDDDGPEEEGPEGEDLDDPEAEGPVEETHKQDMRLESAQRDEARRREEDAKRERELAEQERLRKETEKAAAAKLEAGQVLREAAEAKAAAELSKKEAERKSSQTKMQTELPEKRKEHAQSAVVKSPQKRWLFIVAGLLGGWLGLHLAYARRWVLFALFWVSVIAFFAVVPADAKSSPVQTPFALAVVALWFGGTFFVKKDGKKRRLS